MKGSTGAWTTGSAAENRLSARPNSLPIASFVGFVVVRRCRSHRQPLRCWKQKTIVQPRANEKKNKRKIYICVYTTRDQARYFFSSLFSSFDSLELASNIPTNPDRDVRRDATECWTAFYACHNRSSTIAACVNGLLALQNSDGRDRCFASCQPSNIVGRQSNDGPLSACSAIQSVCVACNDLFVADCRSVSSNSGADCRLLRQRDGFELHRPSSRKISHDRVRGINNNYYNTFFWCLCVVSQTSWLKHM